MVSIHFVKYYVVFMMNLWPLDDGGCILPTRLSPHCEKGHNVVIS